MANLYNSALRIPAPKFKEVKMNILSRVVPLSLFVVYFCKLLTSPACYSDAIVFLALSGLVGLSEYYLKGSEIKRLERILAENVKQDEQTKKDIDFLKTTVASMKMAQGYKTMGGQK